MKQLLMLIVLVVVVPCVQLYAQSASIEFFAANAKSAVQFTPTATGYNGITSPITFTSTPHSNDFTVTITSVPIATDAYRSVAIDLRGMITVMPGHPVSSSGLLRADIEIVDAETGLVLQKENGFNTFMKNLKPGCDTGEVRYLTIDLSAIQVKNIILRFTGVSLLYHSAAPRISISNAPCTDERRFRTGNCDNGNVWWSVTEYTKGKPILITGMDCEGNIYKKAIDVIIVPTDPTKGQTVTDTGAGWFSVVQSDALHRPIWMGGMSVTGDFWETTISYDGGTGNAAPGGGDDGLD